MTEVDTRILEISDRLNRLERTNREVPLYQLPPFEHDVRVPPAESVELVSAEPTSGATKVAIRWTKPADPNIDHFEIWVKRTAFESENPYQAASVADSPCAFTVNSDRDTTAVAYIRTVMKNGLSTDLNASPTVSFNVYKFVASSTDIAPGAIQNGHLDRVSANRVLIQDADIDRVSANRVRIQDADIDRISANRVLIRDADIDRVSANRVLIRDADIDRVSANRVRIQDTDIDRVSVNRVQIRDADIDRVSANRLQVRYGDIASLRVGSLYGGMPGQMAVYNAIGLPIGFIGTSDDGVSGGWFKTLRVGGSSPGNAQLVADDNGNLVIYNSTIAVVDQSGQTVSMDSSRGFQVQYSDGFNRNSAYFNRGVMYIVKEPQPSMGRYPYVLSAMSSLGFFITAQPAPGLLAPGQYHIADLNESYTLSVWDVNGTPVHSIYASPSLSYANFYSLWINGITVIDSNRNLINVTVPAHDHNAVTVRGVTVIDSNRNIGDMYNCHIRIRNNASGMVPGEIVAYYDSNIGKCVLKFYDGANTFTFVSQ